MHPITNISIKAARQAGILMMRYYEKLEESQISHKAAHDFVTEVDKLVEQDIIATVREAYPDHSFLGEEGGESGAEDAEYTWIIDPIDGTLNYIHGLPGFCISIGVKHKGVVKHGVVYDPLHQELFYATKGDGAFLNAHRIRVSQALSLKDTVLGISMQLGPDYMNLLGKIVAKLRGDIAGIRNFGATALHLAYIACGRLDGGWTYAAKPWDIAAGILLVKEAGGLVADYVGGETYMRKGNLLAAGPKVFKELVKSWQAVAKKS